jgi:CelD/BcsL family acetyltransferase involved in cellulose biosynthesis
MQTVISSSRDDCYQVHVTRREAALVAQWNAWAHQADVTPFQTRRWLETWYATTGRAAGQPLLMTVVDHNGGDLVMMMPLVIRTETRMRKIEFADAGLSDYNAPALGPAAPTDRLGAQHLWSAMLAAMPKADFLRFERMPREVQGRVNPLTLLPNAEESATNSNIVIIDGSWIDYTKSLERTFRKELGRSWRVFCQRDGAAFRRIEDRSEGATVLAELERQQRDRVHRKGQLYHLDKPEYAAFYRKLIADGISDGSVVLTALTCRDEIVAALLGVAHGATYVMIRICSGSEEWSNCSPGRLVITQTMQMLHAQGYRMFDFSIGDYAYKRRLGVSSHPLFRLSTAMSPRGLPMLAIERTKKFIKQRPALYALVKRYAPKNA